MEFLKGILKDFKAIMGEGGFWVPLAMAAYGAYQGHQQEKAQQAQNMAAATQTEFSPYTGMGQGQTRHDAPGALGGALTGGASGLSMQQSIDTHKANQALKKGWASQLQGQQAPAPAAPAPSVNPFAQQFEGTKVSQQNLQMQPATRSTFYGA